ncbi:GNAT family N-acetyltransferase [Streptomyces sp. NPDC020681]|uniref:GNAT family N-acetyltransferase n=1 Tax=Streptomyces sp. NPDC020681 TaxID=3365083 RepID=UPI003798B246
MSTKIYRDAWGIPHLRAGSADELAFAQGRNAATDRAWQMETDRHRSQGTSAAHLGESAVGWDRFARQARLDDTARRCFRGLDPDTAAWIGAYVDGVNAGLGEGARRSPEFAETGLEPGAWQPWTPLGIWLTTHILFAGFPTKLWREEVARALGEELIELFATDGSGSSGSNGWLVTGGRTESGAPLIAGDPHRLIEDPGIYQQIHLACPEFDVVGLAVPGVPGIAHFGHTGSVAWAITNAMADYQDLYREQLRRRGTEVEALGPDGWQPASVHTETIEVAGGEPVVVEVIETERGPVVVGGPDAAEAISLRIPPRVTGDLGFEALPALLRARTVGDVDRAFDQWTEPVNVVQAADTEGGLLHRVAGRVPLRHEDNRLRVVPAWRRRHEWLGRYEPMPRRTVDDIAVMANGRGLATPLGVEFAAPHRSERIRTLLSEHHDWTPEGMAAVHMDTHLASATPLLTILAELDGLSANAEVLREQLLGWDRRMDAQSTDAAAYAELRSAVVHRIAGHPALEKLAKQVDPASYPEALRPWLAFLPRVAFALEGLLTTRALPDMDRTELVRAAVEEVAAAAGEPAAWGSKHRLAPWQALPGEQHEEWPALSGDHDCVLSTTSVPGLTDLSSRGPAARYVWDLDRRDNSLWAVPFGASGVPGDPHRRDQLPLWLRGELVPVITDWTRLTEETMATTSPAAAPDLSREAVHEQTVEGFGTVRIVPLDPAADADLVHGWVTEERAQFWGMVGHSREQVREIYEYVDSLSTHHAFLAFREGKPVALFQTYDPAADPVGECYDVQPGDFGIHLLIGPSSGTAERGFTGGLMTALIGFVLSDPVHQRIVVEPDARNAKAIERMLRAGFVLGPEIDKPEKRARLAFLSRAALEGRG